MEIRILELIEGARKAEGLAVIIDVFRAFSLECYLFGEKKVRTIYPVGELDKAFEMKRCFPQSVLIGERGGRKCEGCDYGNSPSQVKDADLSGKTIIHTTSAGTQGVVNAAVNADEIITGSLVNAMAVAEYIKRKNPKVVSLVAMGNAGVREAKEDVLCANYIKSILEGEPLDIEKMAKALKNDGGEHFFTKDMQEVFPEEDFWMCTKHDIFPFVIKIEKDEAGRLVSTMKNL